MGYAAGMVELSTLRKNKISLEDYNYKQDIENRLLMAEFTSNDLNVLEEILYSSIHIPFNKLAENVDLDEAELLPILQKMSHTGLFTYEQDGILVDKEMRKYFETQILKFDAEFKPGMEYLQSLLRRVPIHVLPLWYSIPRTSNNIFDSIVEKYLLTPQIFQRHLVELHFGDPILSDMVRDVYDAPDLKMYASELMDKYHLSHEQFEENVLHLEFHLVCCLGYEKVEDKWVEVVTPFFEWREYATFLRDTTPSALPAHALVARERPHDFSFVLDITTLLNAAKKQPIPVTLDKLGRFLPSSEMLRTLSAKIEGYAPEGPRFANYIDRLISKMRLVKLADVVDGHLCALESANDWLDMRPENRAMFLYRHPLNRLLTKGVSSELLTERALREGEKSIVRVLNSGWVYFDEFMRGAIVSLNEGTSVLLKRQGKTWHYTLPQYSDEELALIKAILFEWLFEAGIIATGTHLGKECFTVTQFGQSLFGG
ncbi:MAG: hypothetical protein JSS61_07040 [Verrucomicrobia bacterium]|nr:hypothetical protein [Verrucomicrobiota bacterium]